MSDRPVDQSTAVDVLRYETDDGPAYKAVEAGRGEQIVWAHRREQRKQKLVRYGAAIVLSAGLLGFSIFSFGVLVTAVLGVLLAGVLAYGLLVRDDPDFAPVIVEEHVQSTDAKAKYDLEDG
jgi:hypothetical protein